MAILPTLQGPSDLRGLSEAQLVERAGGALEAVEARDESDGPAN